MVGAGNIDFPYVFQVLERKTLIFFRFFKGQAQHGLQLGPPRAKMARTSRAELGVRNSPPDPANPANPANPPEVVSGAAVQTLPNHAQESQDDVSSQANSLKTYRHRRWLIGS